MNIDISILLKIPSNISTANLEILGCCRLVVGCFKRSLNYNGGQLMGGSGGCEHAKVETLENEKVALIFEGV